MITIQTKFAQYPQSMCEYQASKDGRYGWLLCTSHADDSHELEEIQAEIKLEILNAQMLDVSKMEIEKWLKDFCGDFHWKIHARLRKTELREKGISLFLAVIYDTDIYFVQFGRIFCAATKGQKLVSIGKTWKNFHVQSMEDLNLFGMSEGDIRVKVNHLALAENDSLIVLPGSIAGRVFESGTEVGSLLPLIDSFSAAKNALGIVLKNVPPLKKTSRRRLSKWKVSGIVLLTLTLLAVLYLQFGNNVIEDWLHRGKKVIKDRLVENAPNLNVRLSNLNVALKQAWSAQLAYTPSCKPVFDLEHIFLAGRNTLYIHSIKDPESAPVELEFEDQINFVRSSSPGVMIGFDNGKLIALDKNNKEVWVQNLEAFQPSSCAPEVCELSYDQDPRLDRVIEVAPLQKGMVVLDSEQGKEHARLEFEDSLRYLSAYDELQHCFYGVVGNELIRVDFNVGG